MEQTFYSIHDYYISHHGIKGQKWGVRRFQNPDGTLTELGKKRYGTVENMQRSIHAGRMSFAKSTAASVVGTAAMSAATKSFTPMIYGVSPTAKTYRKDLEADTGAKNLTKNIFKSIVKTAVLSAGMSLIKGRPTLKLAIQLGPTYSKIKDKKIGEITEKKSNSSAAAKNEFDALVNKNYKNTGDMSMATYQAAYQNPELAKAAGVKNPGIKSGEKYAKQIAKADTKHPPKEMNTKEVASSKTAASSIPKQYVSSGGKSEVVSWAMKNALRTLNSNSPADKRKREWIVPLMNQIKQAQANGNIGKVEQLSEELYDALNA